jgi:hypothetical protein
MKKYRESKQHHVVDRRDIGDNMFLLILIVNKEALELKFSNPTSPEDKCRQANRLSKVAFNII